MAVLTTFTTTHSVIERTMSFEQQIEQLKRQYTDKYCFVDGTRPELARFKDVVGRIKTVNMSGRALVEFDDYHLNIGWYDIAPEYLKVMDEAPPKPAKPEAKKAPAKPAKGEAASAAGKTTTKPAAAGAAKPGKMSVAEMLAAARGGAATPGAAPAKPAAAAPAKAKVEGAPAAKVDRSKMSVADMLAAARAGGSSGAAPAAPAPVAEKAEAAAPAPAKKAAAAPATSGEKVDKSKMTVEQMCDWCRQHDTK